MTPCIMLTRHVYMNFIKLFQEFSIRYLSSRNDAIMMRCSLRQGNRINPADHLYRNDLTSSVSSFDAVITYDRDET